MVGILHVFVVPFQWSILYYSLIYLPGLSLGHDHRFNDVHGRWSSDIYT